jgi:hypothetical protein
MKNVIEFFEASNKNAYVISIPLADGESCKHLVSELEQRLNIIQKHVHHSRRRYVWQLYSADSTDKLMQSLREAS